MGCQVLIMGCTGSKEESESTSAAGGGRNKDSAAAAGSSAAAFVDPRIPLTAKQRYSCVASWKAIARAMEPTGVRMFVQLFEENAEILEVFVKFKELKTKEQQEGSEELAEHAVVVMNSLDNAIHSLENPDEFFRFVEGVGASHRRIPGFKKEYFWKIERPFLQAVSQTLDERYTDNIETIYKTTIHLILETLVQGYDKAESG